MNDKELFDKGCFSMGWSEDVQPVRLAAGYEHKDLQTLMQELDSIKDKIQEIKAKEWHLARLVKFHQHQLAPD